MRLWYRLFLLSVIYSCAGAPPPPADVLPTPKMQAVLFDMIKADETADILKLSDSTYRHFSRRTDLYDAVFRLHAVKKEEFQKSLAFYETRPDLLKEMLDSMQRKVADTSRRARLPMAP